MAHFDIIIQNGTIVDGTGGPAKVGDVGIRQGRIAALGNLEGASAGRQLDAAGLVIAPGFIDMHTHSDLVLLADGRGESMLRQGVTTNVTGNCGMSAAPLTGPYGEALAESVSKRSYGVTLNWSSFADYLDALRAVPKAINLAPLVGHGTIRTVVMGLGDGKATAEHISAMQGVLRQALQEGAFGLSTGLSFCPGMYSDTRELIEVCRTLTEFDALYSSHIRGETWALIPSIKEALETGAKAGVRTNISHHKAVGFENWGQVHASYALIEEAARRMTVSYDMYPYAVTGGSLSEYIPPWAFEGGLPKALDRLRDPRQRDRIAEGILHGDPEFHNFYRLQWEHIQVSRIASVKNKWMEGLRIAQIVTQLNKDPIDFVIDLLLEEGQDVSVNQYILDEADVSYLLAQPLAMVGSDGSALTPNGPTGIGKPHPRSYGAFARVLGHYVRAEGILSLEDAVHKMTGKPAAQLGLKDRGLLREGATADIVVFDPTEIEDLADFDNPHQFAKGVAWVIVNGHLTLDHGKISPSLKGEVLAPSWRKG